MRVLLIEDDPDAMELQRRALIKDVGVAVLTAESGEDGLVLAQAEKPDIIVCDIGLPGIDGYEFVSRIKKDESLRLIPVIALTGQEAAIANEAKALERRFDGFIAKPMDTSRLAQAIAQLLRGEQRIDMLHRMVIRRDIDAMQDAQRALSDRVGLLEHSQRQQRERMDALHISMRSLEGMLGSILSTVENVRSETRNWMTQVATAFDSYKRGSDTRFALVLFFTVITLLAVLVK